MTARDSDDVDGNCRRLTRNSGVVSLTLIEAAPACDPGGAFQVVVVSLRQTDRYDVRRERHRLVEPEKQTCDVTPSVGAGSAWDMTSHHPSSHSEGERGGEGRCFYIRWMSQLMEFQHRPQTSLPPAFRHPGRHPSRPPVPFRSVPSTRLVPSRPDPSRPVPHPSRPADGPAGTWITCLPADLLTLYQAGLPAEASRQGAARHCGSLRRLIIHGRFVNALYVGSGCRRVGSDPPSLPPSDGAAFVRS